MGFADFALDILDVLIVTWLFFRVLVVFRQTKAIRVLTGLGVLVLAYMMALALNFETLLGLVNTLVGESLGIGIILLVVIFSEEIKDTFAGIVWTFSDGGPKTPGQKVVEEVSRACASMASHQIGALIAIAKDNPLDQWEMADSVPVHSEVTSQLLETIFSGKTPLHDGAVIVRRGKIVAAKCQLSPSSNPAITKQSVGMRHRAAFGLSEMSDAVVLVVSEERGHITVMHKAKVRGPLDPEDLSDLLYELLEVNVERKPWYHHERLLANGWLKLLAFGLAFALWANQATTFELRAPVKVLAFDGSRRLLALAADEEVVVNESVTLEKVETGDELRYEQVFPPEVYKIQGLNLNRLRMVPKLIRAWWNNEKGARSRLVGTLTVAVPETIITPTSDPVLRKVTLRGPGFELVRRDGVDDEGGPMLGLSFDKLVALKAEIKVPFDGAPEPGYVAEGDSPITVQLDIKRDLVVTSLLLEGVRAAVANCPLVEPKKLDISGMRKDYDKVVVLGVPKVLSRWNPPKETFRARITIPIFSRKNEEVALAKLFPSSVRTDAETRSKEAGRRAIDARNQWQAFEKLLENGSWEQGLTYETYRLLDEETIPYLGKRIQDAQVDFKAVDEMYNQEKVKEDAALKNFAREKIRVGQGKWDDRYREALLERELAPKRVGICLRMRNWRLATLESLERERDFLTRRRDAILERFKALFDAVDVAEAERDDARKKPPQLPTNLETQRPAAIMVGEKGPVNLGEGEASSQLATALQAKDIREFYSRIAIDFDRRYVNLRRIQSLNQEIDNLKIKIAASQSPMRLELQKLERSALLAARELNIEYHKAHWTKQAKPKTEDAAKLFKADNTILTRMLGWEPKALAGLEVRPFYDLFRETRLELPQLGTTRRLLEEQLTAEALAALIKEGGKLAKEAKELESEAKKLAQHWRDHLFLIRERLIRLARFIEALARARGAPADAGPDFKKAAAEIEEVKRACVIDQEKFGARLLVEKKDKKEPEIYLDDINDLNGFLLAVEKAIAEARAQQSAVNEQLTAAELKLTALASGASKALATPAWQYCALTVQSYDCSELLRVLQQRADLVNKMLAVVTPVTTPLGAQINARFREIQEQYEQSRPPELTALEKRPDPLIIANAALKKLDESVASIATIASGDKLIASLVDDILTLPVVLDPKIETAADLEQLIGPAQTRLDDELKKAPTESGSKLQQQVNAKIRGERIRVAGLRLSALRKALSRYRDGLGAGSIAASGEALVKALTPAAAAAMSAKSLEDKRAALEAELARRVKQKADWLADAAGKSKREEAQRLEERAKLLEVYLTRIRVLRAFAEALGKRVEALKP